MPEPRKLASDDAVPFFRPDLKIDQGASAGLFEVGDPVSGRRFMLYEFEVSIARMLDGRRRASDVVEAGVRLGIPVDLDGLYKFVRQLWWYGFLAPSGTAPLEKGEGTGWGERFKWDEATRTLFQTGLRLMRLGRSQDAQGYFQAVLDADPGNAEATGFLAAIERGEKLTASPIGTRDEAGAAAAPRRWPLRRLNRRWIALAAGALVVASGAGAALVLRAGPERPAPAAPPAKRVPPRPSSEWRTAAVQRLEHPGLGELEAPTGGLVIWKEENGARVPMGARIGVVATRGSARAAMPVDPAAQARIKELEALAAKDRIYRDFLEKERRALRRKQLARRTRRTPLNAPATGVLVHRVTTGTHVEVGQAIGSVVDESMWVIEALMDGEALGAEGACELRGDAAAEVISCKLDSATWQDGGNHLVLRIAAADAPWLSPSSPLRVRVRPSHDPSDARREEGAR